MKVNKTFSVDYSLIQELKQLRNRNGGLRNKSAFVNAAAWEKIRRGDEDAPPLVSEATTRRLLAAAVARDDVSDFLKKAILQELSS